MAIDGVSSRFFCIVCGLAIQLPQPTNNTPFWCATVPATITARAVLERRRNDDDDDDDDNDDDDDDDDNDDDNDDDERGRRECVCACGRRVEVGTPAWTEGEVDEWLNTVA